ncbi:MAG TPA: hypothetical protein VGO16_16550 [Pseudonocardiaceae bacterium]|nr:hypothetical protein [Pseudonocardiaceae bacterium]
MANNSRSSYEHYREAVYARLSVYTLALDNPDDRGVAIIARTELPRYVRYWVDLLGARVPDHRASTSHRTVELDC